MGIDNLMVTLHRVPEIKAVVDTGVDVVTLCGFILTAVAVVAGSIYNSYSFKRSVESQERIAEENAKNLRDQSRSECLARNRQEWINTLRSELANFISTSNDVYTLSLYVNEESAISGDTEAKQIESARRFDNKQAEFYSKLSRARLHLSNIQMHVNPAEQDSIELLHNLELLISACIHSRPIYQHTQDVIKWSQVILKKEWVRVKQMV